MNRVAFTMLELVFVIVVMGILSAAILPRMDRDNIYEVAEQVLSHIRYTQHLAMTNNVYDDTEPNWYEARWQLNFINGSCGVLYRVGSDSDLSSTTGDFTKIEAARDPLTKELIYNNNIPCADTDGWYNDVLIGEKYNITSMVSSCATQTIAFDHIGRPYTGVTGTTHVSKIMKNDCDYTLNDDNGQSVTITVTAETGYAFITYN